MTTIWYHARVNVNVVGRGSESSEAKTRTISSSSSASKSVSNVAKTLKVDETGKEIENSSRKNVAEWGAELKYSPQRPHQCGVTSFSRAGGKIVFLRV